MLEELRAVLITAGVGLTFSCAWAQYELANNAYLDAWLTERGLSIVFLALTALGQGVGFTTFLNGTVLWHRIIPARSVTCEDRQFDPSSSVKLATSGQGPSINVQSGPGGMASSSTQTKKPKGESVLTSTGSPESLPEMSMLVVPKGGGLIKWVRERDGQYRLVEREERKVP